MAKEYKKITLITLLPYYLIQSVLEKDTLKWERTDTDIGILNQHLGIPGIAISDPFLQENFARCR